MPRHSTLIQPSCRGGGESCHVIATSLPRHRHVTDHVLLSIGGAGACAGSPAELPRLHAGPPHQGESANVITTSSPRHRHVIAALLTRHPSPSVADTSSFSERIKAMRRPQMLFGRQRPLGGGGAGGGAAVEGGEAGATGVRPPAPPRSGPAAVAAQRGSRARKAGEPRVQRMLEQRRKLPVFVRKAVASFLVALLIFMRFFPRTGLKF